MHKYKICSAKLLLCPWDSPGKNIGVDCQAVLQGIFSPRDLTLSLKSPAFRQFFLTPPGKPIYIHIDVCVCLYMVYFPPPLFFEDNDYLYVYNFSYSGLLYFVLV